MKKLLRTLVFLSIGILSACSIFQKDSFEGEWSFKLTGAIQETFNLPVNSANEFSASKAVTYGGRDYDVLIKGRIAEDGRVKAEIIADGQAMGEIEGMMNHETGSGKWGASILSGDWSATKK